MVTTNQEISATLPLVYPIVISASEGVLPKLPLSPPTQRRRKKQLYGAETLEPCDAYLRQQIAREVLQELWMEDKLLEYVR